MKSVAATCLLLAVALSACAGSRHHARDRGQASSTGTEVATKSVSSSRLILGGRVRCTATATTPAEVGQALGVTFTFHNVSNHAVKVGLAPWDVQLVVRARDGTRFDTNALVSPTIPYIPPTRLHAGSTRTVAGLGALVRVQWEGPLWITPSCGGTRLPTLRVGVTAPGAPRLRAALADVVAASGDLLSRCRPQEAGVAVQGQIAAPGWNAPPLNVSCSVSIRREAGFLVAQALIVDPPGLQQVQVSEPYERLSLPERPSSLEAIAWQFVVTRNGATPVAAATADRSEGADRMAPMWTWSSSGWERAGDSHCGGALTTGGLPGSYPTVEFISVCHP